MQEEHEKKDRKEARRPGGFHEFPFCLQKFLLRLFVLVSDLPSMSNDSLI